MAFAATICCLVSRNLRLRGPLVMLLALAALSAGASGSFSQQAISGKEDEVVIRGTVINSVTHAPVNRALVHSLDNRFAMLTDDQGRFEFKVAQTQNAGQQANAAGTSQTEPAASFFVASSGNATANQAASQLAAEAASVFVQLRARRPGYLADQNAPELAPGSDEGTRDLVISLVPEAVMTGRVNLPSDSVADRAQVELYRRQVLEGRGQWVQAGATMSDSEGEFRFADLPAGEYKVFTTEILDRDQMTFDPRAQFYGFPPVYFPNAGDFDSAGVIHLAAGTAGFANLSPVRREYYPVRIAVANGGPGGGRMVAVFPQGHEGPGYSLSYNEGGQAIEGLLPTGAYTLQVASFGEGALSGQMNFSVRGAPFAGHAITLAPNSSISVNVKHEVEKSERANVVIETLGETAGAAESGPTAAKRRDVQVTLIPLDDFHQANAVSLRSPRNPEDDSLVLESVPPGRYRVRVDVSAGYPASVDSGGTDLLRQPLVIVPGIPPPPINITVREDVVSVYGEIENWSEQTRTRVPGLNSPGQPPACVYFVPAGEGTAQFRIVWIGPDGKFGTTQIPPGEYHALAFDRQPADLEFENSEEMSKYEGQWRPVHLGAGAREELKLSLIRTEE